MKKTIFFCMTLILLSGSLFAAQKGKKVEEVLNDTFSTLPNEVKTLLSPKIVETMQENGFKVFAGTTPPKLDGEYELNDLTVTYDPKTFPGAYPIGYKLPVYIYKLKTISPGKVEASYYSNEIDDSAKGMISNITGTGNCFTIYIDKKGSTEGCKYRAPFTISACTEKKGLKDFKTSYTVKSKTGSPICNELMPIDHVRVVKEGDRMAENYTGEPEEQPAQEENLSDYNTEETTESSAE